MAHDVTLPALGESVTEGTVTRWLKAVGDTVAVDEPLLEISTDKVDTEIPSPVAGTLTEILVPEDETVAVGAVLARIGEAGESAAPAAAPEPAKQPAPAKEPAPAQETPPAPAAQAPAPAKEPEPAPAAPPAAAKEAPASSGAAQDITLPALGESVTEGTVTRWLKAVGDAVAVDEPLLEISTDKVDTEIPSPVAGTLSEIVVGEDETVGVGAVLARVATSGGAAPAAAPAKEPAPAKEAPPTSAAPEPAAPEPAKEPAPAAAAPPLAEVSAVPPIVPATPTSPAASAAPAPSSSPAEAPATPAPASDAPPPSGGAYVTPLVRKLAAERGVDLSSVAGTGVGGRIRKEDVLAATPAAKAPSAGTTAAAPALSTEPSPLRGTTVKMTRLRTIIAERMMESLHGMAQLTTVVEVDVSRVWALRARAKEAFQAREGAKLTFLPFFTYAAAEALRAHAGLNASVDGENVVYHGSVNLGIAVDTDKGLIVPTLKDADSKSLADHAREIADLGERGRSNKLSPDDLSGGTFTVTNTGSIGAVFDTPIVPAPQVAILGTGVITKRPVVVTGPDGGEMIAIRPMCYLALSYDHRIVDGADASRFLQAVKTRIEEGAFEAEVGA